MCNPHDDFPKFMAVGDFGCGNYDKWMSNIMDLKIRAGNYMEKIVRSAIIPCLPSKSMMRRQATNPLIARFSSSVYQIV